jgi:hypothetical protein
MAPTRNEWGEIVSGKWMRAMRRLSMRRISLSVIASGITVLALRLCRRNKGLSGGADRKPAALSSGDT